MTEARRVGRILLACVAEHDWDQPSPEIAALVAGQDLRPLLRRAAYHGVDNLVFLSLRALRTAGVEVDAEILSELEQRYTEGVHHHLRVLADLADLTASLQEAGHPCIVFKGPVLSATVYGRVDLRSYHDVDLLVPRSSFAPVVEALEAAGATLLDRNWDLLHRLELGQVHLQLRHGTLADLHWHLANRKATRRSLSIPIPDLFARARTVTLSGIDVTTFDPVDTVVHLCVHTALAGGTRLLWLKDVERAVSVDSVPWDKVVDRARAWGAAVPVGTVLQRASRALGAPVPSEVVRDLLPSTWARRANVAFDRLWPPEATFARLGPSALWVQSRRDRPTTTATLLVGRQRERWLARAPHLRARGGDDWSKVLPAFRPAGGLDGRRAFFEAVSGPSEPGPSSDDSGAKT